MTGFDIILAALFLAGVPAPRWLCDAFPTLTARCERVYVAAELFKPGDVLDMEARAKGGQRWCVFAGTSVGWRKVVLDSGLSQVPYYVRDAVDTPRLAASLQFPTTPDLEYWIQDAAILITELRTRAAYLPQPLKASERDRLSAIADEVESRIATHRQVIVSRDPAYSLANRRIALRSLHDKIGPRNFWEGRLPPLVPAELYEEKP